jgi:hypothetical protein
MPELDFGQFLKRRMRETSQNIGVHRLFSGSRARPGPCENSRRHRKYLQTGRFRAAKIGQSPAEMECFYEPETIATMKIVFDEACAALPRSAPHRAHAPSLRNVFSRMLQQASAIRRTCALAEHHERGLIKWPITHRVANTRGQSLLPQGPQVARGPQPQWRLPARPPNLASSSPTKPRSGGRWSGRPSSRQSRPTGLGPGSLGHNPPSRPLSVARQFE